MWLLISAAILATPGRVPIAVKGVHQRQRRIAVPRWQRPARCRPEPVAADLRAAAAAAQQHYQQQRPSRRLAWSCCVSVPHYHSSSCTSSSRPVAEASRWRLIACQQRGRARAKSQAAMVASEEFYRAVKALILYS
eukprot:892095-Prymnesium_polylepis.1